MRDKIYLKREWCMPLIKGYGTRFFRIGITAKEFGVIGRKVGITSGRGAYENHLNGLANQGILARTDKAIRDGCTVFTVAKGTDIKAIKAIRTLPAKAKSPPKTTTMDAIQPGPEPKPPKLRHDDMIDQAFSNINEGFIQLSNGVELLIRAVLYTLR